MEKEKKYNARRQDKKSGGKSGERRIKGKEI
jgi:hypothetical protein